MTDQMYYELEVKKSETSEHTRPPTRLGDYREAIDFLKDMVESSLDRVGGGTFERFTLTQVIEVTVHGVTHATRNMVKDVTVLEL